MLYNETMVVLSDRIKELKARNQELLDEQGRIITMIKTKYPAAYHWVVENGIDLTNLKMYAASIATAFIIVMGGSVEKATQFLQPTDLAVNLIEVSELQGLNEDEKAKLVWERYGTLIRRAAQKYNLDPKLIFATIMLESGGNTYAIRQEPQIGDASYGLGQILYGTAVGLGFRGTVGELYDPAVNIELIGRYHRRNLDVYGQNLSAEQLTIAYNAGSPYSSPHPGHLAKFNRWFTKVGSFI